MMSRKKSKVPGSKQSWQSVSKTPMTNAVSALPDPLTTKAKSLSNLTFDDNDEIEDEVMGEVKDPESRKSNIMERNLNQMIDVLHLRLSALEDAARVRQKFCEEDLNPRSKKMSKQVPKLMEDFEDGNPRIMKDKISGGLLKV